MEIFVLQEQADTRFMANTPSSPKRANSLARSTLVQSPLYATGNGLEVATFGEKTTATLHGIDADGKEYEQPLVNTSCELVSDADGPTIKAAVQKKRKKYTISYQPAHRGKHQLHINVERIPIRGSPFAVIAVKDLSIPIRTIGCLNRPWGVAVNQRGEIIVAEKGGHCISIFSPNGKKIRMFGSKGSAQGQLNEPCDVAVDGESNVLVVDRDNHRIQKFTGAGEFVTVGQNGRRHLEFSFPSGIAINHMNRKVYICDQNNHRVNILNADLTFFKSFGSYGNGDGQFNWPWDATFDTTGNVYVADWGRDCIQVFTAEGNFLRKFGKVVVMEN